MRRYILQVLALILFLIIFIQTNVEGQNSCYINLGDVSGIDISQYQTELNEAACELVQAFPAEFQDQFKVYDIGFYSQNEFMEGGFQAVLDYYHNYEVNSPYYLVFGRQYSGSNGLLNIWISLKLPNDPNFPCKNKENQIVAILEGLYNPIDGSVSSEQAEIEIMRLVKLLRNCEDCENEIDDDGDGFVNCEYLDLMIDLQ